MCRFGMKRRNDRLSFQRFDFLEPNLGTTVVPFLQINQPSTLMPAEPTRPLEAIPMSSGIPRSNGLSIIFSKNCGVHQAGQDLMPPTRRDMPPAIWIGMNIHKKDWPYRTLPSYFVWPCLKCGFGRWVSTKNGPFAGSNCWFGGFDVNYSFCAYPSDWWSFGESDTGWITFEHLSSYQ